ncbi:imidazolonepropionase [Luteitalea pratensis]|uniref:Imidazolonepropionase n=1 Tax=Luteitalea pratensis TaxID=1855912 RepID=A0A143PJ71_LUTPR|nr:amidohydrolase family protein [Luteitalea pratensis]AMY08280.1 imidazolonepropionase [Luteitalea pratensis]
MTCVSGLVSTIAIAVVLSGSTVPAAAQDPGRQAEITVLRAARLLDVRGGRIVDGGVVIVQGGKITAVGGAAPAGARVVDLGDVTLAPGLIDLHTHLTMDIEGNWVMREVTEGAADAALRGARNARATVEAGFTTVRNLGSQDFSDIALAKAITAGFVPGPRIVSAGHSIGATGGHCDTTGFAPGVAERDWRTGVADGPDEVVKAVRYQIKHGAQVIKICATAGVLSFDATVGAQQLSEAEMTAVVQEAALHGLRVAAHAHGTVGIKAAVRAGVTSIEHGSILDDEAIAMMKERGTYLVPTSYLADALNRDALPPLIRAKADAVLPIMRESLRKAIAAGVKVALGTDAAVYPHGQNGRELGVYVALGMAPIEAVRSATTVAAEALGVSDRGAIETGMLADIIAVPGNPLQDIKAFEQVRFVMVGGKVVVQRRE